MLDNIIDFYTKLVDKLADFIYGSAYALWKWLGEVLDVKQPVVTLVRYVSVPYTVYKDRPETVAALAGLVTENDELLAVAEKLREEVDGLKQVNTHLLRRNSELGAGLRSVQPTGDDRPNQPKLTQREVNDILYFKRIGWTQKAIADTFDVNPATISRIVRGQYHKNRAAA